MTCNMSVLPDINISGTTTSQKWQRLAFSLLPTRRGSVSMVTYSFPTGLNSGHSNPSIPGFLQGRQPQQLLEQQQQKRTVDTNSQTDISVTDQILTLLAN